MNKLLLLLAGACIALLALLTLDASPTFAQSGSGCLKCQDSYTGCSGGGPNCCCKVSCESIPGGVTCSCTAFCPKCGNCWGGRCGTPQCTLSDNNKLESEVRLSSLGSPEQLAPAALAGWAESGSFDYSAAVATRVRDKSVVVATVLDNLTTRCGDPNRERVVLSGITNAPFSGGVNITENNTVTTYAFAGRLSILDRRAVVELEYTPPGKDDSVLLRAVVPEEGEVTISETELPPITR